MASVDVTVAAAQVDSAGPADVFGLFRGQAIKGIKGENLFGSVRVAALPAPSAATMGRRYVLPDGSEWRAKRVPIPNADRVPSAPGWQDLTETVGDNSGFADYAGARWNLEDFRTHGLHNEVVYVVPNEAFYRLTIAGDIGTLTRLDAGDYLPDGWNYIGAFNTQAEAEARMGLGRNVAFWAEEHWYDETLHYSAVVTALATVAHTEYHWAETADSDDIATTRGSGVRGTRTTEIVASALVELPAGGTEDIGGNAPVSVNQDAVTDEIIVRYQRDTDEDGLLDGAQAIATTTTAVIAALERSDIFADTDARRWVIINEPGVYRLSLFVDAAGTFRLRTSGPARHYQLSIERQEVVPATDLIVSGGTLAIVLADGTSVNYAPMGDGVEQSETFISLSDTPAAYPAAPSIPRSNAAGDGLEFVLPSDLASVVDDGFRDVGNPIVRNVVGNAGLVPSPEAVVTLPAHADHAEITWSTAQASANPHWTPHVGQVYNADGTISASVQIRDENGDIVVFRVGQNVTVRVTAADARPGTRDIHIRAVPGGTMAGSDGTEPLTFSAQPQHRIAANGRELTLYDVSAADAVLTRNQTSTLPSSPTWNVLRWTHGVRWTEIDQVTIRYGLSSAEAQLEIAISGAMWRAMARRTAGSADITWPAGGSDRIPGIYLGGSDQDGDEGHPKLNPIRWHPNNTLQSLNRRVVVIEPEADVDNGLYCIGIRAASCVRTGSPYEPQIHRMDVRRIDGGV